MILLVALLIIVGCHCELQWRGYEEGFHEIETTHRPGILLVYHPQCPACRNLNRIMEQSDSIRELASHFVLIRCSNGKVPADPAFRGGSDGLRVWWVDGLYVPRLFFISKNGTPLVDVKAAEDSKYSYYYYHEDPLVRNMKRVLAIV